MERNEIASLVSLKDDNDKGLRNSEKVCNSTAGSQISGIGLYENKYHVEMKRRGERGPSHPDEEKTYNDHETRLKRTQALPTKVNTYSKKQEVRLSSAKYVLRCMAQTKPQNGVTLNRCLKTKEQL